jgi:hypothetical protein
MHETTLKNSIETIREYIISNPPNPHKTIGFMVYETIGLGVINPRGISRVSIDSTE